MSIVELHKVSKSFGPIQALDQIDLVLSRDIL